MFMSFGLSSLVTPALCFPLGIYQPSLVHFSPWDCVLFIPDAITVYSDSSPYCRLDLKSMQNNGPEPFNTAQKAIVLHTSVAQVDLGAHISDSCIHGALPGEIRLPLRPRVGEAVHQPRVQVPLAAKSKGSKYCTWRSRVVITRP